MDTLRLLSAITILLLCAGGAGNGAFAQQAGPGSSEAVLQDGSEGLTSSTHVSPPKPSGAGPSSQVIAPVYSVIEVKATLDPISVGVAAPHHFTGEEVFTSAGTWGDFTRYLNLLPGVVWNSDATNDVIIRGGNPSENLFVIDGIEVPNINHMALEGSSGGFTSMLDTSSVQSIDMYPGVYDVRYTSRLSSLVDIHTRNPLGARRMSEINMGITGAGGLVQEPLGRRGAVLVSAHRSLLNAVTDDIGVNGVPTYTNGFAKAEWSPGNHDHFSLLSLNGGDSIDITPQPCDPGVTLGFQTQYGGVRSTYGFAWQHTHSARSLSTVTSSYSDQKQTIDQQEQTPVAGRTHWCIAYTTQPAYDERTRDRTASLNYESQLNRGSWIFSMGSNARLLNINYAVAQTVGQQSPFSTDPTRTDVHSFHRNFLTGQTAFYGQASGRIGSRLTAVVGARPEFFALTASNALNPRASLSFRLSGHQTLSASWQRLSQLPPVIQLVSYPDNEHLGSISTEQFSVGADLWEGRNVRVDATVYRKNYSHEPVSTEYPTLMLANMVNLLGEQFVWLPLKDGGRGHTQGIEITARSHWGDRMQLMSSVAYSRAYYAAADGVLRPGNFDKPLVGNGMVTLRLPLGLQMSFRDTYASGRVYTPFNIPVSIEQARGIYDLTRVNAARGPAYNRIDADLNRSFKMRRTTLMVYGGVENMLDRINFFGYSWESHCKGKVGLYCGWTENAIPGVPMMEAKQMPRFPSAGIRLIF